MNNLKMPLSNIRDKIKLWDIALDKAKNGQFLRLLITTFILLCIYYGLRIFLFNITTLPFEAYNENVIQIEFLKKILKNIFFVLILLSGVFLFRRKIIINWKNFENGLLLRNFITIICCVLAWLFAFYEYNFFFNQSHLLDRILLLGLLPLVFWRPLFVIPFIIQTLLIIGQFEVLKVYSLAVPSFPIHICILFISFYIYKIISGHFRFSYFIFLLGCVFATEYVFSGLGKLLISSWFTENHINYLIPNAYANGWLSNLDQGTIFKLTESFDSLNLLLKILTLTLELGPFIFFFKRLWTKRLIAAIIILHIGIFIWTGIFFWTWMLIDATLIILISHKSFLNSKEIFNPKAMLLSFFVVITGFIWNAPPSLAWLDSPLNYIHKIYGETENGKVYELSPDFFHPYDYQFTLTNLNFLHKKPSLGITAGTTGDQTIIDMLTNVSDEEIFALEKNKGNVKYNENRKEKFIYFIRTFLRNKNNEEVSTKKYLSYLKAPDLLWTHTPFINEKIKYVEKIRKVSIVRNTTYYSQKTGYRIIRKDTIQEIEILK